MESPTALLSIEMKSLTFGYRALDLVARRARILEATVIGAGRFLILAEGEVAALKSAFHDVHQAMDKEIVDHEVIDRADRRLLEATFSLAQMHLLKSLIVVEVESVSGLLSAASSLLASGIEIIEIKIHRAAFGGGYGFFTAADEKLAAACAENVRTRLRQSMREGDVAIVEEPSAGLRAFFHLDGKP